MSKMAMRIIAMIVFIIFVVYIGLYVWFRVSIGQVQKMLPLLAQQTFQHAINHVALAQYQNPQVSTQYYWAPKVDTSASFEYMDAMLTGILNKYHHGPVGVVPLISVQLEGNTHQAVGHIFTNYYLLWFHKELMISRSFHVPYYKFDNRNDKLG